MAFNKRLWKGRQGTGLNKFSINGATPVTVINQPDSVTEQGDALSAGNLNDLEDRIYDAFDDIADGTQVVGKATADASGNVITTTYATKSELTSEATARANADSNLLSAINSIQKQIDNITEAEDLLLTVDYKNGETAVPANVSENAEVGVLRGVSRVENSLCDIGVGTETVYGVTKTVSADGKVTIVGTATNQYNFILSAVDIVAGHKYLLSNYGVRMPISAISVASLQVYAANVINVVIQENATTNYIIGNSYGTGRAELRLRIEGGSTYNLELYPFLTDLTQYFNTTDLSFLGGTDSAKLATIQSSYPWLLLPSDYEAGILVSTTYEGVKSKKDFFDQLMELGKYNNETGAKESDSNRLRTVNRQPCTPNTTYYFDSPTNAYGYGYDTNGNYLGSFFNLNANSDFTTPNNCHSFAFYLTTQYGTTYGNDIHVIGELDSLTLPSSVTLRSAGDVAEEYYPETGRVTHPLYRVNLGNLTYEAQNFGNGEHLFRASLPSGRNYKFINNNQIANMICSRYVPNTYYNLYNTAVKGISYGYNAGHVIIIADSNYTLDSTGEAQLKADLANMYLYYEQETSDPDTYVDPLPDNYIKVEPNGTIETVQSQSPKVDGAMTVTFTKKVSA